MQLYTVLRDELLNSCGAHSIWNYSVKLDMRYSNRYYNLGFFVFAFFLAACSSSGGTTVEEPGDRAPTFDVVLQALPQTETFDERSYHTEPPVFDVEIEHDVPADLLAGSIGADKSSTRKGYRIQVVFAREKALADQAVDEMHGWLSKMKIENPEIDAFQQDLPVYNVYLQPYFRVRIGDFNTREEAEVLLTEMIDHFPKAFVMVDQINVD